MHGEAPADEIRDEILDEMRDEIRDEIPHEHHDLPPDHLNDVGVLKRREIEARVVAPLLERLAERFGPEVYDTAREVIVDVARQQGAALAERAGDDSLPAFAAALGAWSADGALETEVRELTTEVFAFDVTRCRYAEMYRALGMEELGATLSCNRDGSLMQGFNPEIEFTRTQTIMSGADHCDFRFRTKPTPLPPT
jgi:predicted ArsR family transcriptional regulator